ncbi:UROD/MetE-like protein [Glonium stellatum]|uniref:UROD/MetE-like protein n=1 Tax=Glonium stellatum TaxID=574774 RepID=A0A8E2JXD5_9PEZI|nr:UROD/MetE-like protein [Glonium stellatum]
MPIPTEVVGSLPRPTYLQKALVDYDAGKITYDDLFAAQDQAAKDSIERMEATGSPLVTDGEQRASSFATYPIIDTLGGAGLADNLKADGQYFAIFDDGHHRQLPRLISGPLKYRTYASDYFKKSKPYATRGMKQAVIAPSMLYLLYPLNGEVEGYSKDQFVEDLVKECEKDIRKCFEAGAQRVSIDFTEGRLASKNDPRNPWTGANLLKTFVDLNNKVLDRFTAEERKNIGIHACPGGDCDSVHSYDVDYHKLLPSMFQMNAGYFLIQLASEKDKEKVYKEIGETIRRDADGVKQVAFIGVVNPLDPKVESPEEICEALLTASKYIPKDQLGATDDCGFSPFSIDVKPKHGSPDLARDIAFQKIANRIKGVKLASDKLGI